MHLYDNNIHAINVDDDTIRSAMPADGLNVAAIAATRATAAKTTEKILAYLMAERLAPHKVSEKAPACPSIQFGPDPVAAKFEQKSL
jgi:hypothetical protein